MTATNTIRLSTRQTSPAQAMTLAAIEYYHQCERQLVRFNDELPEGAERNNWTRIAREALDAASETLGYSIQALARHTFGDDDPGDWTRMIVRHEGRFYRVAGRRDSCEPTVLVSNRLEELVLDLVGAE